jgi:dTDP-4-amino-4,6-dideoxygalactose transaminase
LDKIWLSSPHIGDKEIQYVNEAFQTNWIAPLGPNVDAFEKQLSQFLKVNEVVSLSSGTAALHLALIAVGVKSGDIVLCQTFTFAASAFPILYLNAEPVFIDSEKETWNIDPELTEKAIIESISKGKKPAAIIIVHLYGMPAKMNELLRIAKTYDIPVIEDAAEALGSEYHNSKCGSMGTVGVLSFNGNKIITTSGGGGLTSNDTSIIKKVRHLSAQSKEPAPYYLHKEIGYNYRLSNVCAGIGRGQMEVLHERVNRRREIYNLYKVGFKNTEGISFVEEPLGTLSNRWLTTLLFDKHTFETGINNKVRIELERQQIESRLLWKPLHQQPVFENKTAFLNGVSDNLFENGLCLPSGSNLTNQEVIRTIESIKKVIV